MPDSMHDVSLPPKSSPAPTGVPALHVNGLDFAYPRGPAVLTNVSFDLPQGKILAILGASGCGKSTLLRVIAGLEQVNPAQGGRGEVSAFGKSLHAVPVHKRGIGMVFQRPYLFPHRSVGGNVAYGLPRSRRHEVDHWLKVVGLDGYAEREVSTLSGGQAQRVALARSLAARPKVLLLDEPLSALDRALRESLSHELRSILVNSGVAAVYVTHDHSEAFAVADTLAVMSEGAFIAQGSAAQLFASEDPQIRAFFGAQRSVVAPVVREGQAAIADIHARLELGSSIGQAQKVVISLGVALPWEEDVRRASLSSS